MKSGTTHQLKSTLQGRNGCTWLVARFYIVRFAESTYVLALVRHVLRCKRDEAFDYILPRQLQSTVFGLVFVLKLVAAAYAHHHIHSVSEKVQDG